MVQGHYVNTIYQKYELLIAKQLPPLYFIVFSTDWLIQIQVSTRKKKIK